MIEVSKSNDSLGFYPVSWKKVTIWLDDQVSPSNFEAYTSPACGWWYRLRKADHMDTDCHKSGFVLEAWRYGDASPQQDLAQHPMFANACEKELMAALAILVFEQSSPEKLGHEINEECMRLGSRISSWAENPPSWIK